MKKIFVLLFLLLLFLLLLAPAAVAQDTITVESFNHNIVTAVYAGNRYELKCASATLNNRKAPRCSILPLAAAAYANHGETLPTETREGEHYLIVQPEQSGFWQVRGHGGEDIVEEQYTVVSVKPVTVTTAAPVLVMDSPDSPGLWRAFQIHKNCAGLQAVQMFEKRPTGEHGFKYALAIAGNGHGQYELLLMNMDDNRQQFFGTNLMKGIGRACKVIRQEIR